MCICWIPSQKELVSGEPGWGLWWVDCTLWHVCQWWWWELEFGRCRRCEMWYMWQYEAWNKCMWCCWFVKTEMFQMQKFGHISADCRDRKKGKGDNKQVIKGKGKQKGKKGKDKGKGFGKKGKMNEVGYENDYDGTDMWWQDDGSWWEDQSWLETSQVWNGSWMSHGTMHGMKVQRVGTNHGVGLQLRTNSQMQVLQVARRVSNLLCWVLWFPKFLQVLPQVWCLKQTVQTNLKQFAAIFYVMKPFFMFQLQVCSAWNQTGCFAIVRTAWLSVMILVQTWSVVNCETWDWTIFLTVYHQHVLFLPLNFTKSPNSFLFLTASLHVQSLWTSPQTLEMNLMTAVMMKRKQTCANVEFGFWMGAWTDPSSRLQFALCHVCIRNQCFVRISAGNFTSRGWRWYSSFSGSCVIKLSSSWTEQGWNLDGFECGRHSFSFIWTA